MVSDILFLSDHRHLGGEHDWLVLENQTVIAKPKQLVWQEFSWMEKALHILGFGRANLDTVEGVLYEHAKEACEENKTFIQGVKAELPTTLKQHIALIGRVVAQGRRLQHLCNSIDRLDNQMRACRDKRAFFKGLLALVLEVFRGKAPRLGGKQFGVYDEMDKLSRLKWKLYNQSECKIGETIISVGDQPLRVDIFAKPEVADQGEGWEGDFLTNKVLIRLFSASDCLARVAMSPSPQMRERMCVATNLVEADLSDLADRVQGVLKRVTDELTETEQGNLPAILHNSAYLER